MGIPNTKFLFHHVGGEFSKNKQTLSWYEPPAMITKTSFHTAPNFSLTHKHMSHPLLYSKKVMWWGGTSQLCKSVQWVVDSLTGSFAHLPPLLANQQQGWRRWHLWGGTDALWDVVRSVSRQCRTLKPWQRQTAQQQLSCWLCNARWGLHRPLSSVQVPSVWLWSSDGFSGRRGFGRGCRTQNVGQQVPTPATLCCPEASTLWLSLKNLHTFRSDEEKTLEPLSVGVFSV